MGGDGVCSRPNSGGSRTLRHQTCEDWCGKYLLRELDENTMTCVTSLRTLYALHFLPFCSLSRSTLNIRGIVARKLARTASGSDPIDKTSEHTFYYAFIFVYCAYFDFFHKGKEGCVIQSPWVCWGHTAVHTLRAVY